MPCNILLGMIKNCRPKGKKKQGETIKETSRSVRPELVNKWPNCMLASFIIIIIIIIIIIMTVMVITKIYCQN